MIGSNRQPLSYDSWRTFWAKKHFNQGNTMVPVWGVVVNWKVVGLNPSRRWLINHYATTCPKYKAKGVNKALYGHVKRVVSVYYRRFVPAGRTAACGTHWTHAPLPRAADTPAPETAPNSAGTTTSACSPTPRWPPRTCWSRFGRFR